MSGGLAYGTAHPQCHTERGHVCQRPTGKPCIESGCDADAGTLLGPAWCPEHDQQRLQRVTDSMRRLGAEVRS